MTNENQNPDQDQEKTELRQGIDELRERVKAMEDEDRRKKLTANGLRILKENGLNESLLKIVNLNDEDKFKSDMERITGKKVGHLSAFYI